MSSDDMVGPLAGSSKASICHRLNFLGANLCSIVSPETLRALNGPIEFYRAGSLNEGLPRFFFTIRRNYRRRMAVISFDLI